MNWEGERKYLDRQKELSVFLRQLQQSAKEMTGERVTVRSATKTDGGKILEIVIGENPLFVPVICVETSGISYKKNSFGEVLQRVSDGN